MNLRALIFDIYGTLLHVGPPPADAARQWDLLWQDKLGAPARLSLAEFAGGCDRIIAREHSVARQRGVRHPEIYWPAVAGELLPELARLSEAGRDDFLFHQARLWHTVELAPGAAEVLSQLGHSDKLLGLASNSQPYTLRELDEALAPAGLNRSLFKSELSFFSFQHGFSKPDPEVFRLLTARLQTMGVAASETLMVGDRLEEDIETAQMLGWRTWWLADQALAGDFNAGGWGELAKFLQQQKVL